MEPLRAAADGGASGSEAAAAAPAAQAGGGLTDVLARKAKEKEVEAFKAALPRAHPIFTELEKVGSYERSNLLYERLCHRQGNTLTVVAEYYRKAPWGFLGSVLEAKVRSII